MNKVFALVWGQCTDALQATIHLSPEYTKKAESYDGIWLMSQAEKHMAGIVPNQNHIVQLREKLLDLLLVKQRDQESVRKRGRRER